TSMPSTGCRPKTPRWWTRPAPAMPSTAPWPPRWHAAAKAASSPTCASPRCTRRAPPSNPERPRRCRGCHASPKSDRPAAEPRLARFRPPGTTSEVDMAGKFEIGKRRNGEFQFNLKAGNGQVILSSQGYKEKASALNGIEPVRRHAVDEANFERLTAKDGSPYFNLRASNGEVIGHSEMYSSAAAPDNGIESVKGNAPGASVVGLTARPGTARRGAAAAAPLARRRRGCDNGAMRIGPYALQPKAVLAPMAGVTDKPFRLLCKRLGAGLAVSEMTTSDPRFWNTRQSVPRMDHAGEPDPVSVQIAGTEPAVMAEAARHNAAHGAHIIDINMGCPAKKVCSAWAGSALMRDELLVARILEAVVAAVDVPVTLKI